MKKIPTIFERDWEGDRSMVLDKPAPGTEWVFNGEGVPTQKLDGTCCMIRGGQLFRRRETTAEKLKNKPIADFEAVSVDYMTEKVVGWVPVGDGPEDKYHREAMDESLADGTYELIGPKIQGNPEGADTHRLVAHNAEELIIRDVLERTFGGIKRFLAPRDFEGIVFHHPDGRMAKIKKRDFGMRRA